jgi:hypothetical protein
MFNSGSLLNGRQATDWLPVAAIWLLAAVNAVVLYRRVKRQDEEWRL